MNVTQIFMGRGFSFKDLSAEERKHIKNLAVAGMVSPNAWERTVSKLWYELLRELDNEL